MCHLPSISFKQVPNGMHNKSHSTILCFRHYWLLSGQQQSMEARSLITSVTGKKMHHGGLSVMLFVRKHPYTEYYSNITTEAKAAIIIWFVMALANVFKPYIVTQ